MREMLDEWVKWIGFVVPMSFFYLVSWWIHCCLVGVCVLSVVVWDVAYCLVIVGKYWTFSDFPCLAFVWALPCGWMVLFPCGFLCFLVLWCFIWRNILWLFAFPRFAMVLISVEAHCSVVPIDYNINKCQTF